VPEAPVDEDRQSSSREHDVRSATQTELRGIIDAETKPSPMELATKRELRTGIAATICLHSRARSWGRSWRLAVLRGHLIQDASYKTCVRPSLHINSATTCMSKVTSIRRTAVPQYRGAARRLRPSSGSPDAGDLASVRRWAATAPKPRAIDLFCGAGGLSLGLRDAGFSVLVGADADAWAVETHTANVGGLGYVGDLSDPTELLEQLDGWGIDHVELVAGGVPCQPFSRAGQSKIRELIRSGGRHPQDPRASLWRSFMLVVEKLAPQAVLVENVPDLPSWDDGAVLSGFLETLGGLGYEVDAKILDCYRYGVPQHRSRLVLTALGSGRRMIWPKPSDQMVTLRDAIGDLPPVPGGQRAERLPYRARPHTTSPFQRRMRRDLEPSEDAWVHDHITRAVRADDWEAYTGLEPGQTYADIPAHLQRYRTDIFTDKYKRLSWDELSRTITAHIAKDGYWYIHPEQHRTLSVREAARLQTFPDSFRFAGQPSHRYSQIGNAVPPLLAEAVGEALIDSMSAPNERREPDDAPRTALLAWHRDQPQIPWRRLGTEPWLVLAAELTLDRTHPADLGERFAKLADWAPSPDAALSHRHPGRKLEEAGLSPNASEALVRAAQAVVELFDGSVPDDDLELRAIPGVGDSVAKMVLCFGFGRKVVPLHSAAARVASRVTGRAETRRWQLRLDLYRLSGPVGPDASFNAAVIELGSTICRSDEPLCRACPIRASCAVGRTSPNAESRDGIAA
jgi:DNA (cytosine-5)-methyltransferase 1